MDGIWMEGEGDQTAVDVGDILAGQLGARRCHSLKGRPL